MIIYADQQAAQDAILAGKHHAGDRFQVAGRPHVMIDDVWMTPDTPEPEPVREWTDEQNDVAYDTFRELADHKGTAFARDTMRGIQRMGAKFAERDLAAWVERYVDEHVTSCEWFAMCDREATTTRAHPILGEVPICGRCDSKF
ncbi:hypothetical protein [Saccharopolyspora shandongensis]|uniref:hypothetical protein n=1 Tax=Saccharopolyspora shandongensis TaxID=418495 RepID=UPI003411032C